MKVRGYLLDSLRLNYELLIINYEFWLCEDADYEFIERCEESKTETSSSIGADQKEGNGCRFSVLAMLCMCVLLNQKSY